MGYKRIAGHGMIAGYRRIAGFLAVCALITGMPFDAQGRVAAAPAITGETTPLAEASASPGETPPDPAPPEETLPPEPAPLGEIMPLDPELFYGDTVTFELVNVETGGELTCQWYKDGELLDDETLPKLTIDCVSLSDAGVYSCEAVLESPDEAVKLVCESVLSVSKAEPLICVSASPESGSLYSGEGITLTAVVSHPVNGEADKPAGSVSFFVDDELRGSVTLSEGEAVLSSVVLTSDAIHAVYAEYSGDENYAEVKSEEIPYSVGKLCPSEGTDYTRNQPGGENGWYRDGEALEIVPAGLFDQIREGETGEWKTRLEKSEETAEEGSDVVFYLRNSGTGEISNPETVSYRLDRTQPDIKEAAPRLIEGWRGQQEWESVYCGDIYGGGSRNTDNFLYYITLEAEDTLSGVAYFQWKYKNSSEWSEQIPAEDGKAEIALNYNQWNEGWGIDAAVCDGAGNQSVAAVSPGGTLCVEYARDGLRRYVDAGLENVMEEDFDADTRLIYNRETPVILTLSGAAVDPSAVEVSVNGQPADIDWMPEGRNYTGRLCLAEGRSEVKITAPGCEILTNETGSRVVLEEYTSNIHIVDTVRPVVTAVFEPEGDALTADRRMSVSVCDENFRPEELYFSVLEAKDISGDDISGFCAEEFLDALKNAPWKTEGNVHSAEVAFTAEAYYSFTLEYQDMADNAAVPCEAVPFAIDKEAPYNLRIAYGVEPAPYAQTGAFGYYNQSVTIRLYADDAVSGVDCFDWTYTQEDGTDITGRIDSSDSEHFKYDGRTAEAFFTLTADEFTQYRGSFRFTATDKAGHTGDACDDSGRTVILDTISPEREVTYPEPQVIRTGDTQEIFCGDKAVFVNEENTGAVIYYDGTYGDMIPVTLKITEKNFYAEDVDVRINGVSYTVDDWIQNGDEWTGTIRLTDQGKQVITAAYTDRSGNSMPFYQSGEIVIDREKPVITKYEFTPAAAEGGGIAEAFVEDLEYGYYFQTGFTVKIYASDSLQPEGVEKIVYRLVSYGGGSRQGELAGTLQVTDGMAVLALPAGFKGQIFAEAYDYVGNKSGEVTPRAVVVDNAPPVIEITENSATAYRDAAGNPLYVTDTSVTVTVTDTVSGIREIGYAQSSEKNPIEKTSVVLNNTGYSIGDSLGDGWIISAMDRNLVTRVTKTFPYDSDNNDVTLTVEAADRAGNYSSAAGSTFTVDRTPPVIRVAFRSDGNTGLYYNEKRVADVTVIERNFDASRIHMLIENKFGSVPEVAFVRVSDTEHRAVITFGEGDYSFEVNGTDLGSHTAQVDYTGGSERLFFVDSTKPVIGDNFAEFSRNETGNSFNRDMEVSVSIEEHNFEPELARLRILQKDAGSEHNGSDFRDVTAGFAGGIRWSADGDMHTASFTVSEDAVYKIEITAEDLAGNGSDYRSTPVFEIDKTAPVVSARSGRPVSREDAVFLDVYTYERREEAAPTVEFSDLNLDYINYELTVWTPDYTASKAAPVIRREQISGVIQEGRYELPGFTEDGVYALELEAVDAAGNTSGLNISTYARMVEQDVLAYITNSSVENKSGLYSFQYENGTPISMRPDNFTDLDITVFAKEDSEVDIVLRDTNAEEIYVNAQADADNSIYGFTVYNFTVGADFFKDSFSGDTDTDLYLTVKNDGKRIDLGRIHIDNVAPTCELPGDFSSWHWYFGEEARVITISNISEQLDEESCRVYDNGEETEFVYSGEENTLTFTLGKGWHSVGVVLADMAGNENNIRERVNIYVGWFWLWAIGAFSLSAVCIGTAAAVHGRRRRRIYAED